MEIVNSGVSADSLFHFTSEQKFLENILRNGFYIRYSLEDFSTITNVIGEKAIALPMVCFCDIPLSQIKYHSNTYGSYAIGMNKEWAMKEKISPLIYTFKNALTAELLNSISTYVSSSLSDENIFKDEEDVEEEVIEKIIKKYSSALGNIEDLVKFLKPYKGKIWRNGGWVEKEIVFYNEKEWRYMPTKDFFEKHDLKGKYGEEIFEVPAKRRAMNLTLQKLLKLKFSPKDIKYIIVRREDEIPNMVEKVRDIFKDTASHSQLQLLFTKIFSLDQIISDI